MTTQGRRRRAMKLAVAVDAALHCSDSRGMAADLIQNALDAAEQRGRDAMYNMIVPIVLTMEIEYDAHDAYDPSPTKTGYALLDRIDAEIRSRQDKPAT